MVSGAVCPDRRQRVSGCLRGCLLDRCLHLTLRKLQVFLAEEPEAGSLRAVLAAGVSAPHVELAALQLARGTPRACPVAPGARVTLRLHSIHYALNERVCELVQKVIHEIVSASRHRRA